MGDDIRRWRVVDEGDGRSVKRCSREDEDVARPALDKEDYDVAEQEAKAARGWATTKYPVRSDRRVAATGRQVHERRLFEGLEGRCVVRVDAMHAHGTEDTLRELGASDALYDEGEVEDQG